ncbi:UNVERIFIED_CONTAM: hypothetical protein K2H54_000344 [Gekko kuhli]
MSQQHQDPRHDPNRVDPRPRGTTLTAKSWLTEAPLRMLMNNLDPEVAEHPQSLVVYGGIGRAARNWACFDKIVEVLTRLEEDQTLLVQSGKPVGVFQTHKDAPRVLIANSNLVPHWANWEHFNELDKKGLMMYGQMTAGSWIYIGTQGIVQGTYETFFAVANQHFNGEPKGRWILTGGLGGMGGAQPLAATMAGFSMIAVECDETRIDFQAKQSGSAVSVGLLGNAADVFAELVARGITPDVVTDQTSAHDPVHGYLPQGWSVAQWRALQKSAPQEVNVAARHSMARQVEAMLTLQSRGAATLDYGNNIRQMALEEGVKNAFDFPGFVPAYIRPLFLRGHWPVPLGGAPPAIRKISTRLTRRACRRGSAGSGVKDRVRLGLAFNEMVKNGELKAPIVIGRDHLDSGSVASPNRETESMMDGSDAVSDWPLLNALLNTAGGATWVSLHHGGGVGMGFSQHSGVVIVCDGSDDAAKRVGKCNTMFELTITPGELDLATLRRVSREPVHVSLDPAALAGIHASAAVVTKVIEQNRVVYGINTGFGLLANTRIPVEQLDELQRSIVLSHAAGIGEYMDDATVRLMMVLKLNSLARGFSASGWWCWRP